MNLLLSILLLCGLNSVEHDIQVAYYKIHQDKDELIVNFTIEQDDLNTALDAKVSDQTIKDYINDNFSVSINGDDKKLMFKTSEIKDKHLILLATISKVDDPIKTIKIKNTCLKEIEDNSNIIQINLFDSQRDFLMNRERTSIEVSY